MVKVLSRGNTEGRHAQEVTPGASFLSRACCLPTSATTRFRKENVGNKLADWIANQRNPLTARVMVNRLWHHHFGKGLVETPSDFGNGGSKPTHPELLDWLAQEFIRSGWSVKHMQQAHRDQRGICRSSISDCDCGLRIQRMLPRLLRVIRNPKSEIRNRSTVPTASSPT